MNEVRILDRQEIFRELFFRIEKVRFQQELPDGAMCDEIVRLSFDRGNSTAALLHDTDSDSVVLVEQFRFPTYDNGPGWILEIPAGVLERGEDARSCMCREIKEETGYSTEALESIATVYPSPGGCTERISIYYAPVTASDRTDAGGGLDEEGEYIHLVSVPVAEAYRMIEDGRIVDAKTVIALQWLKLRTAPQKP